MQLGAWCDWRAMAPSKALQRMIRFAARRLAQELVNKREERYLARNKSIPGNYHSDVLQRPRAAALPC
jgi:hypothetical protein